MNEATRPHLSDYATERFTTLCRAARYGEATPRATATFRRLVSPWGNYPVGSRTEWASEISDDNTPIELSVTIDEHEAEVRALLEPQAPEATVEAHRREALTFFANLERDWGADLRRFRAVQEHMLPEGMQGPFAVWASAVFPKRRPAEFKAYFNPQAHGAEHAPQLVHRTLASLGLSHTWSRLSERALRRGPTLDELKYFALDLTETADARVKVYVRHHACRAEDLEAVCANAADYVPGEVSRFVRAMQGGDERLWARAAFTCSAYVGGDERPAAVTAYVPVCAYNRDDSATRRRVQAFLEQAGLAASVYETIMDRYPNRGLGDGTGLQSWAAFRRYRGRARVTAYLAIEANQVYAPGAVPAPTPDYSSLLGDEGLTRSSERPLKKRA